MVLNYIEGYARSNKKNVHKQFLEISYGSLQESKYLIDFSLKEGYIDQKTFQELHVLANDIGAMLWNTLKNFP